MNVKELRAQIKKDKIELKHVRYNSTKRDILGRIRLNQKRVKDQLQASKNNKKPY